MRILYYPVKPHRLSQGFAKNANSYYAENGLVGHTGDDIVDNWNDPIFSSQSGIVYKIINKDNPDLMRYRCVFTLVHVEGNEYYEISYGHLNEIIAKHGNIGIGDTIGTMGNTGDVASGGRKITHAEKKAGSKAGTHLHFQIRKVVRTKQQNLGQYLSSEQDQNQAYRDTQGYYYWIPNYDNGFNGCINAEPLYNGKYAVDYRVSWLKQLLEIAQRLLSIKVWISR